MSYSENNSFEQIMERTLANPALANVDKRVGSVIWDATSPMAMELANAYVKMDILEEQSYLMTATGKYLDKKAYDYGVKRIPATKAKRVATFKKIKLDPEGNPEKDEHGKDVLIDMEVPEGTKFSTPDEDSIIFVFIGVEDGNNILECEQFGVIGNKYEGSILPMTTVTGLAEAKIIGTYQPANDEESDDDLRARAVEITNNQAFGGNIEDYIQIVKLTEGAGNCKVFPAWQYNGSVLLSVVDSQYNPATTEFQQMLKKKLDPEEFTGQGRGMAPIGHYVTVTAPVKKMVTVGIKVDLEADVTIGTVREAINAEIEKYFNSVRQKFGQNSILAIYKARIIDAVLNVKQVLNVSSVTLNEGSDDLIYKDEAFIGSQYLPYIKEVIIG